MWDDSLHVFEALLMLACYVGYIACCLHTMRDATPRGYAAPGAFHMGELVAPQICVELSAVADGCGESEGGGHAKGDGSHFIYQGGAAANTNTRYGCVWLYKRGCVWGVVQECVWLYKRGCGCTRVCVVVQECVQV